MVKITTAFFIVLLVACTAQAGDVKRVSAKDAYPLIKSRNPRTSILIDGRSAEMFASGHIDGAINIDAFESSADKKLQEYLKKQQLILYCTRHKRSDALVEILKSHRFAGEIVFISDGITGWRAAGYEVTR